MPYRRRAASSPDFLWSRLQRCPQCRNRTASCRRQTLHTQTHSGLYIQKFGWAESTSCFVSNLQYVKLKGVPSSDQQWNYTQTNWKIEPKSYPFEKKKTFLTWMANNGTIKCGNCTVHPSCATENEQRLTPFLSFCNRVILSFMAAIKPRGIDCKTGWFTERGLPFLDACFYCHCCFSTD